MLQPRTRKSTLGGTAKMFLMPKLASLNKSSSDENSFLAIVVPLEFLYSLTWNGILNKTKGFLFLFLSLADVVCVLSLLYNFIQQR